MAAGAVGFLRIVEQAKTAHFGLAQAGFTLQPVIVLAGVGVEARLLDLIAPDREQRLGRQELCVLENSLAEQGRKLTGVWRMTHFLGNDLEASAVHLARVEQRAFRLDLKGVGPAVPEQASLRNDICCLRGLGRDLVGAHCGLAGLGLLRQIDVLVQGIIGADTEFRLPFQVGQRRNSAHPWRRQVRTAKHHGRIVRRTIGMIRTVTRRASHLARRRQGGVEEYVLTQSGHRGKRCSRTANQTNRLRVFAGLRLRLGSEDGAGQKADAEEPHDRAIEHLTHSRFQLVLLSTVPKVGSRASFRVGF